uniref:Uncharacterized protein n=1 Tax=viral metagenome TaxID=1070528 RepID=A0A6C0DVV1_9ZZZZ
MTGHTINTEQNQEFLSTMHTMIDDLDTISSLIDEDSYLRLVNGLQRLYNIVNSPNQTSRNSETMNRMYRLSSLESIRAQPLETLVRHYERVNDISGIPINNDAYPINNDANAINNDAINTVNNDITNYNINNENNQALNRENARISYAALYADASDYWNHARYQNISSATMTISVRAI